MLQQQRTILRDSVVQALVEALDWPSQRRGRHPAGGAIAGLVEQLLVPDRNSPQETDVSSKISRTKASQREGFITFIQGREAHLSTNDQCYPWWQITKVVQLWPGRSFKRLQDSARRACSVCGRREKGAQPPINRSAEASCIAVPSPFNHSTRVYGRLRPTFHLIQHLEQSYALPAFSVYWSRH